MKKHIGKITVFLAFLLVIVASIMCFTIFSAESSSSEVTVNWNFDIIGSGDAKTAKITGASITGDYTRSFAIPSTVTRDGVEYPVTEIKEGAFNGNTKVFGPLTIPDGVTKIGYNAFKNTQIYGEVIIPSTVTSIGYSAFENCKGITKVTLPEDFKTIDDYVFKGCTALRSINLENVTKIQKESFNNCNTLYNITLTSKLTYLGNSAFANCKSLDQTFDLSSVTSLGDSVFSGCNRIKGFKMPNTSFNLSFFSNLASLESIEVLKDNENYITIDGVLFNKKENVATTLLLYPLNKSDSVYTVPKTVTTIGKAAFAYAKNLETVKLGDNVETLSPEAFMYSSLTHEYLPNNIYSMSVDLFKGCKNLEWVVLGNNIAAIGTDCFKDANKNVTVIAKNPRVTPSYDVTNFISMKNYQCIDHYYGYNDAPATCEAPGYKVCIVCERVAYEKQLEHSGMIIESSELSCDTDEYIVIDCLTCGKHVKEISREKTGHQSITYTVPATSTTPGYTRHFCYVCSETYVENYTPFLNVAPCSAHSSFSELVISEPSCKTNGLKIYYCTDCGKFIRDLVTDKAQCSYEVVSDIVSSCTVEGVLIERCTVCQTEKITKRPLIAHDHEWYTISEKQGYEYSSCKRCGLFESREVDYSVLNALLSQVSVYYETYYSPEAIAIIRPIKESQGLNLTQSAVNYNVNILSNTLANLSYNVTDVPVVFIETTDLSEDYYSEAKIYISYLDENGNSCVEAIEQDGEIKIRGNSTADYKEKYPYNIKFSTKVDLFGMGAGKKYCLLANLFDQTLIRNALVMDFSKAIELQYSQDYEFVDVYYNGQYYGLYLLTTPMDIGEDRIDIDEENDIVLEVEKVTGDHVNSLSEDEKHIYSSIFNISAVVEGSDDLSGEAYSKLFSSFNMVDFAIKSGDWNLIDQYVDIESVSKYFLIHEYLKEVDMCFDSTRFYMKDGKLYGGPVWDFDLGLGNLHLDSGQPGDDNSHNAYNNEGDFANKNSGVTNNSATGYWADCRWAGNKNIWFPYLVQYSKEFNDEIKALIKDYADIMRLMYEDKIISKHESIRNNLDNFYKDDDFTAARIRNYRIFTIAKRYNPMPHNSNSYAEAMDYLRAWLKERHEWMYKAYLGVDLPSSN